MNENRQNKYETNFIFIYSFVNKLSAFIKATCYNFRSDTLNRHMSHAINEITRFTLRHRFDQTMNIRLKAREGFIKGARIL